MMLQGTVMHFLTVRPSRLLSSQSKDGVAREPELRI